MKQLQFDYFDRYDANGNVTLSVFTIANERFDGSGRCNDDDLEAEMIHVLQLLSAQTTTLLLRAIPLGILRNSVRIATIILLCEHVGPQMIHSSIHTHGGPLFFFLALIPLLLSICCGVIYEGRNR